MEGIFIDNDEDGLFFDRLQAFCETILTQISSFAARENRPVVEIIKHISEWCIKYLLQCDNHSEMSEIQQRARYTLEGLSQTLISLNEVSGLQSFILAVDPDDDTDEGFLGGTVSGREFWRTMRGGGSPGAKTFRARCKNEANSVYHTSLSAQIPTIQNLEMACSKQPVRSSTLKNEVYVTMRNLLKSTSGIRNAEMKWSKPDKLKTYGVCIVGWPPHMEFKNPSQMSVKELSSISDLIQKRELYFQRLALPQNHADAT